MFARTPTGLFFALALAFGKACFAETSTEVLQRMNSYRDNDARDIQQRTETRAWQEIKRKEEYARDWKCYGAIEVNASRWRQFPDLTWITEIKRSLEGSHCFGPSKQGDGIGQSVVMRFGDTLRQSAQRTGVSLADLNRLNPGLDSIPSPVQPIQLASLWVKIRSDVQLEELATQLSLNETQLARLNEVNENHRFLTGDWLVLPTASSRKAKNLSSLDTSALRRTPPIQAPLPLEPSVVRFGDTLRQIAQRTGVSLADLTRLNPDLEAARLVVGSQIRVPQSASNRVVESSFVAINCAKLLIVQKPAYAPWGEWSRPDGGSSLEKLVVDRCASKSPLQ